MHSTWEFAPLRVTHLSQKRLGDENSRTPWRKGRVTGSAALLKVAATTALLRLASNDGGKHRNRINGLDVTFTFSNF